MIELLSRPWPWYVVGAIIGAMTPLLLLIGNRQLGISGNLRTICAAVAPRDVAFFRYDWRNAGGWNLAFALGILVGGFIGGVLLASPEPVALSEATRADLAAQGIRDFSGFVPHEIFSLSGLLTARGLILLVGGGFLVGFGAAYGGGCTSGHGISGIADLQLPSFIAVCCMFAAGIAASWFLIPLLL